MKHIMPSFYRSRLKQALVILGGLLILPLGSSIGSAGEPPPMPDFNVGVVIGKGTAAPGSHYVSISVTITPDGADTVIAGSQVLLNGTKEISMVATSTPGRMHIHEARIGAGDALGSFILLEVFAVKRGVFLRPGEKPPLIASSKIDLRPTLDMVSPELNHNVKLAAEPRVFPRRYPPVVVSWRATGVSGPYELTLSTRDNTVIHRESGLMTDSCSLADHLFESGKYYIVLVEKKPPLALAFTGSFSFRSAFRYTPHAMTGFTVIKL